MSKVVVATAYGGPEVLSIIEVAAKQPGPGEVLIAVRAAGINPVDGALYSGSFGSASASLPMRLGYEAAGVVTAVGADARGVSGAIAVGDEVIAYPVQGAYADELVVPAAALVPKPPKMSWPEAGGLMLTGATATHTLEAVGLRSGELVLIHGASGGVGLMAVQLAVARGATVIGTARPSNHGLLHELGATPVAYGPGLAERVRAAAPRGIDAAIDCVGTDEAVDVSLELCRDRSRIVTIAAFQRGAKEGIKRLGRGPGADPGEAVRAAARMQLTNAFAAGRLRIVVTRTYPLVEVAAAHRDLKSGHTTGKIVLLP